MAYTIIDDTDTTDLGKVQTDGGVGSNGLFPITLPESNASNALLIPTTGAEQKYTLNAQFTGSVSEIATFITKLKKWKDDGGKLSKANLIYISPLDGTVSIRVTGYSKNWSAGNPRILNYTIEMVEGLFF